MIIYDLINHVIYVEIIIMIIFYKQIYKILEKSNLINMQNNKHFLKFKYLLKKKEQK